jgi:hypothetical protein
MATNIAPTTQSEAASLIEAQFDGLIDIPEEAPATPQVAEKPTETPQDANASEDENVESTDDEPTDESEEEGVPLNLASLAKHLDMDIEDLYGLELPTKVNGEESVATLRDMVKSHQLESMLNKKSMKLSDDIKAANMERNQVKQERESYLQSLTPLLGELNRLVQQDTQVDWQHLADTNPAKYTSERAKADARLKAREVAESQYQYLQTQQLNDHVAREATRLPELIPEWDDESIATREKGEIAHYLKNNGYSDQDIHSISYGKGEWIATVRKAMLFDKAKSSIPGKQKLKSPPRLKLKSGVSRSAKEDKSDTMKAKFGTLQKSGKLEDAANLIQDMLD